MGLENTGDDRLDLRWDAQNPGPMLSVALKAMSLPPVNSQHPRAYSLSQMSTAGLHYWPGPGWRHLTVRCPPQSHQELLLFTFNPTPDIPPSGPLSLNSFNSHQSPPDL